MDDREQLVNEMAARVVTEDVIGPAKDNPDAGPGMSHDFQCTHDPCVCMSGDEHPSGLRDAILEGFAHAAFLPPNDVVDSVESVLIAALSVVSEGEIDAAARAMCVLHRPSSSPPCDNCRYRARSALAASREVLIPKETT